MPCDLAGYRLWAPLLQACRFLAPTGPQLPPCRPVRLRRLPSLLPLLLLGIALELLQPRHLRAASPQVSSRVSTASSRAGDNRLAGLVVLAYHEIAEPDRAAIPDYAVRPADFAAQLEWLVAHGYHFVSVDQLLAARAGRQQLPPQPVLLSFDDGYRSVWTSAFPVLRRLHAPAVVGLVGRWLEPRSGLVAFGDGQIQRDQLLSWDELRAMVASGLVEVANHTWDLHRGISGNPQGNSMPAVTTRHWDSQSGYEQEATYRQRLAADLEHNSALLARQLGQRPRVVVWPYGRYNATAAAVASAAGMPLGLNLDDGPNTARVPPTALRRILICRDSISPAGLARELEWRRHNDGDNLRAAKVMHVDLDNIHDPDPAQTERNLRLLLARIRAMGVNTVYLQAFADPDGNGAADALYFPNRELPVRDDLFSHVAWEIRTRTPVRRLYAWMPVLAFQFPTRVVPASERLLSQPSRGGHLAMGYPRISPFAPAAMARVRRIYADLSRTASFDGLLFHDDVTLSDYEDASPAALNRYRSWGLPTNLAAIRADDRLLGIWTNRKTDALENLTLELAALVRRNQPQLLTARNLYAQVVLNPHAEAWYAQSLDDALRDYDFTAVMAMPYMEQARDPTSFLTSLVEAVKQRPLGLDRVLFELQSTDWRKGRDLSSAELADQIRLLYRLGAHHLGYYPDNLHRGTPDPALIQPLLTVHSSEPKLPR